MQIEYRRDIHTSWMILSPDACDTPVSYRLKMITSNEIPGFVRCFYEVMNGAPVLYYDISGMQPLARAFGENKAGSAFFRDLINALLSAFHTARDYLLDAEDLLLTKDTVFLDPKTGEIRFVCFPFETGSVDVQMKELAAFLLSRASEEPETIKTAFHFYTACTGSYVTADALMEILRSLPDAAPQETVPDYASGYVPGSASEYPEEAAAGPEAAFGPAAFMAAGKPEPKVRKRSLFAGLFRKRRKAKPGLSGSSGAGESTGGWEEYREECREEMEDLEELFPAPGSPAERSLYEVEPYEENDDGETVVLSNYKSTKLSGTAAWLVPSDVFFGETAELVLASYVIGRGRSEEIIDLGIRAVSRRHASLSARAGTYEISDLGSRNGTFVNGIRLAAGERRLLADGDVLKFAEAEYRFLLKSP